MSSKHPALLQSAEYKQWLTELKQKVALSQQKAVVKVNTELLILYWQLGEEIVARQQQAAWGDKLLAQLSQDLMAEFPQMKGFSKRNLEHVRRWYLFWCGDDAIAKQAVSQLVQIPWGHNIQFNQYESVSPTRGCHE
ncbi:DUF1016 N-terminal domain-containing protein [Pseudoalteromonas haloplanktis]|uniref:DUF1016 N-terminal domain-containing protein n=1 Tax=Pseudoalteromonas haloplanktis TaxID=228 RepID=A0ABU1B7E3_PSEHA|nr:DUF1016 N-terminal domain-containing protein [Pseudoalteromonas haloplanktis]MDQ9090328.1 DUF1016 N-terminal domain-containing protein [Pseudoalteromonas haloplanktis]